MSEKWLEVVIVVMAVIITDLSHLVKHTLIHKHAMLLPTLTPCSYHQLFFS